MTASYHLSKFLTWLRKIYGAKTTAYINQKNQKQMGYRLEQQSELSQHIITHGNNINYKKVLFLLKVKSTGRKLHEKSFCKHVVKKKKECLQKHFKHLHSGLGPILRSAVLNLVRLKISLRKC